MIPKDLRDRHLWEFALILTLLVYGPELAHFTLSIDEELHSYSSGIWRGWASQGRWGMALLTYTLPYFSPLPFLPTLIFCLGLAFAALLLSRLVAQTRQEVFVFVGLFVTSPIWLHIGEFNTFSWGFGVALSIVALAATLARRKGKSNFLLAALCAGFATSIYQTILLLYGLILLLGCVRGRVFPRSCDTPLDPSRPPWGQALNFVAATAFYYCMNAAVLALLHAKLTYVDSWIRLDEFSTSFSAAASRTLQRIGGLLVGTDPIFLDWGAAALLPSWLGFAIGIGKFFERKVGALGNRLLGVVAFAATVSLAFAPVVISAGRIPTRALTTLPFLYAVVAVNAFRVRFNHRLQWCAFGLAIFVNLWISTSLFYAERLARQRDLVLVNRLVSRVESVGRERFGEVIPLVVVGAWSPDREGPARRVEIFGESFFEHGGGDNFRIGRYLRLMGISDIKTVSIARLRNHLDRVDEMPSWPDLASTAVVGNVVVLKMGQLSPPQRAKLIR